MRTLTLLLLLSALHLSTAAQNADTRPPVIDVHLHAPLRPGPVDSTMAILEWDLAEMDRLNIRMAVLNALPGPLEAWHSAAPTRLIPSLLFPCEDGLAPNFGRPCFDGASEFPDIEWLRGEIAAGRIASFGELVPQYLGLEPGDPRMEAYWALAEEMDIPVFIHMGPGPPFAAYDENPLPRKSRRYRATMGNPLLLEEVLLKHPRLRVAVMHAGWPLVEEMIFMLYQHPNVYAEVGLLHYTDWFPRAEYYGFLRRLVDAGFANRILFGSDYQKEEGIKAILDAPFLDEAQKHAILCTNASRFLKLDEAICR